LLNLLSCGLRWEVIDCFVDVCGIVDQHFKTWWGILDTLFDTVCQWLSPGTPVSSINKTDRHDIIEILLKVALNTINQSNQPSFHKSLQILNLVKSSRIRIICLFLLLLIMILLSKTIFKNSKNYQVSHWTQQRTTNLTRLTA
jgi:hypothetical protein